MLIETYEVEAMRTLPPDGRLHLEMVTPGQVHVALLAVIAAAKVLDGIKKSYVYGRALPDDSPLVKHMEHGHGISFNSPMPIPDGIIHGTIGAATEVGEMCEALVDAWFDGKHFDQFNAVEEGGDVLWYLARYLGGANSGIEEAMKKNIAKLHKRHLVTDETPHNFNRDAFSETGRDRLAERVAMETADDPNVPDMKTRLRKLDEVTAVATSDGNAKSGDYMRGMANGLILAQATMKDQEPVYIVEPASSDTQEYDNAAVVDSVYSPKEEPGISCLERFDNGSEVWLESYAGGASKAGMFGELSLRFFDHPGEGGTTVKYHRADTKEPQLGCATNKELAAEMDARASMGHTEPDYRTVD